MSSTNRGYDRHVSDYYVTPKKDVTDFLNAFIKVENIQIDSMKIIDPACGGDKTNDPTYTQVIRNLKGKVFAMDIREDSKADVVGDFLHTDFEDNRFNMVITNPPFALAMEFIKKGLDIVVDGGYVIMLLRLNFMGSKMRKPFFDEFMPKYIFTHHKRISFLTEDINITTYKNDKEIVKTYKKGSTDSIEYAHFVWQKGYTKDFSKTFII